MSVLTRVLTERYRCPADFLKLELQSGLDDEVGFFQFGPAAICYGRSVPASRMRRVGAPLYDVAANVQIDGSTVSLPFDPAEIVENLRLERYPGAQTSLGRSIAKGLYYTLRPFLHDSVRAHIQRFQLREWRTLSFPGWPVDSSVEGVCEHLLSLVLRASGADRVPFIWFWPEGMEGCLVMTHDIEGETGKDFCAELMDIDDSYGMKASFHVVPEGSYSVSIKFLDQIRNRGFEIGIQDLNHDGRLYDERNEFLRRAKIINQYAREYAAKGFRAAVLYRKPEWYDAFDFSFDMSIPNTARLDPQRGGCCTVMPYSIGKILELPVTTTQDYMLCELLEEGSIDLWKEQVRLILDRNGLISFIIHPDYVARGGVATLYRDLLQYLRELRATRRIWLALPSEVDCWWRARARMQLVWNGDEWHIEGDGEERAVLAYARNVEGELMYEMDPVPANSHLR